MTHPSDEQLNDLLERELSPADHVEVSRHVETCPHCALVVAELQQIMRDAASLQPMTPPDHLWNQIGGQLRATDEGQRAAAYAQLDPNELRRPAEAQGAKAGRQTLWRMHGGPAWALATAALIIVAFLTGRLVEHRARPASAAVAAAGSQAVDAAAANANDAAAANVRERVLLVAVGDHLERSQVILVELANAHTRDALDISAERQSADELLASNRLYRQTAAQIGQTGVADLLDDLERVLVEVANGPSEVSMQELAAIQQRIEAQGILFKVKIIGSDIRERGNSTTAGRKQPVS
jgi:anti-sigma factor RsiW